MFNSSIEKLTKLANGGLFGFSGFGKLITANLAAKCASALQYFLIPNILSAVIANFPHNITNFLFN